MQIPLHVLGEQVTDVAPKSVHQRYDLPWDPSQQCNVFLNTFSIVIDNCMFMQLLNMRLYHISSNYSLAKYFIILSNVLYPNSMAKSNVLQFLITFQFVIMSGARTLFEDDLSTTEMSPAC